MAVFRINILKYQFEYGAYYHYYKKCRINDES